MVGPYDESEAEAFVSGASQEERVDPEPAQRAPNALRMVLAQGRQPLQRQRAFHERETALAAERAQGVNATGQAIPTQVAVQLVVAQGADHQRRVFLGRRTRVKCHESGREKVFDEPR